MTTEEGRWLEGLDERTEGERMSAEHSSEEGGEGCRCATSAGGYPCGVCVAQGKGRVGPACTCPTDDYCPKCHPRWHAKWVQDRAESAEAERDDLRGRLAAVEALCDPANEGPRPYAVGLIDRVLLAVDTDLLRAVLANPSAAQGEGEGK